MVGVLKVAAQEESALAHAGTADPKLAVAWNQIAYDIAFAEDQFLTFKGHRAHAMMHIAMHDALNAVLPVYRQFAYRDIELFAHPVAAAAQAAHDLLLSQYPNRQPALQQTTTPWNGFVVQPGFRFAKPFGLRAPSQFRPVPPPALESTEYAAAYNGGKGLRPRRKRRSHC